MSLGILGRKLGMTQIFDEEGRAIPVTVVEAGPCPVTQLKSEATDGYTAVQVGFGTVREKVLTKPEVGHCKKAGLEQPVRHLREFAVEDTSSYSLGQLIGVDIFEAGQLVDVVGTSIGKGFAGGQKRHHFGRGPMAHGSKNHRAPGSIGAGTTPGRVFPGKKMPGRMGNERVTVRRLTVVRVIAERNLLLIKGGLPGVEGGLLIISPAKRVGR
ncbi:50S ribosomal protein L3 [Gloeobacter kilaueensis]|uniref:Large ribosomal subunit protein uL3 n=1 Tax=Gloeobacter kilaueensis (strain ATCC BAA-2537 / CCAP 1431/1 / ULC 316 / JS1) TaxID=1183438 RepID=U5QBR3_GLOK1|nr:50S ribosomal protein L3 [Gloeobacter kilaueensis]AGY56307.1 50S ribosomal protein L3 [Gloeobacter kilaueensis JS1]